MRPVEIDRINAVARECAARLGLEDPEIRPGRVPSWVPIGLRARVRRGRPVLTVGTRFAELDPVEQEAMLAGVLAGTATLPGYRLRFILVTVVFMVTAPVPVGVTVAFLGWVGYLLFLLFFAGFLYALVLTTRWFSFAIDRRVVETFGRPLLDVALDFDRRNPPKGSTVLRVLIPGPARRAARLDRLRTSALP